MLAGEEGALSFHQIKPCVLGFLACLNTGSLCSDEDNLNSFGFAGALKRGSSST